MLEEPAPKQLPVQRSSILLSPSITACLNLAATRSNDAGAVLKRTYATALRARRAIGTRRQGHAPERPYHRPDLGCLRQARPSPDGSPAAPPPRRSRPRRSAPRGWAADAIPAVHHVEAMLQTRRENGYTRTSRVVMRGNPPWWWPFRSPVLCPVSGARRAAGAPAQRIDSRYARRVTRRSTPSLPRMLLR